MIVPLVSSRTAARMLGVTTHTLACWRCAGEGPQGWRRISKTLVVYPVHEVEAFLESRNSRLKDYTPFPEQQHEETANV